MSLIFDRWNLVENNRAFALFPKTQVALVSEFEVDTLLNLSIAKKKNGRICLHSDERALSHYMLVAEHRGLYYPPHKHERDGELFSGVHGNLGIVLFADDGSIVESFEVTKGISIKVPDGCIHAVYPLTDVVMYFESKRGPYRKLNDDVVSWAPRSACDIEAYNIRVSRRFQKAA